MSTVFWNGKPATPILLRRVRPRFAAARIHAHDAQTRLEELELVLDLRPDNYLAPTYTDLLGL